MSEPGYINKERTNTTGKNEQRTHQPRPTPPTSHGRTRPTWDGPTVNLQRDPATTLVMDKVTDTWANAITNAFPIIEPQPPDPETARKVKTAKELFDIGLQGATAATENPEKIESLRHIPEHAKEQLQELNDVMFRTGVDLIRLGRTREQALQVLHLLSSNPLILRDVSRALSGTNNEDDFERNLQRIHMEKHK